MPLLLRPQAFDLLSDPLSLRLQVPEVGFHLGNPLISPSKAAAECLSATFLSTAACVGVAVDSMA
ncbi:MAG: hypothetical protein HYX92_10130 [Chloroflexi bacterium]|nr:hypothetical protein [Chloroflexota bacterium]